MPARVVFALWNVEFWPLESGIPLWFESTHKESEIQYLDYRRDNPHGMLGEHEKSL